MLLVHQRGLLQLRGSNSKRQNRREARSANPHQQEVERNQSRLAAVLILQHPSTAALMTPNAQLLKAVLFPPSSLQARHWSGRMSSDGEDRWKRGEKKSPTRQPCEWDLIRQRSKKPHVIHRSTSIKVCLKEQGCER